MLLLFLLSSIPFYDAIGQAVVLMDWEPLRGEWFRLSFVVWSFSLLSITDVNVCTVLTASVAGWLCLWTYRDLFRIHIPT
jgi:hypothetical protein